MLDLTYVDFVPNKPWIIGTQLIVPMIKTLFNNARKSQIDWRKILEVVDDCQKLSIVDS